MCRGDENCRLFTDQAEPTTVWEISPFKPKECLDVTRVKIRDKYRRMNEFKDSSLE